MRKLFHIEGIIDFSIMHELMLLLDGKSMNMTYRPVKHGGEDENGNIKSKPSGKEFLLAFAQSRKSFTTKEAIAEAAPLGLSKASVYAASTTMTADGTLKRIAPNTYALAAKATKPSVRRDRAEGGKTVSGTILDIVRAKQNGSGEGVHLKVIKDELRKAGFNITGASPAVNALMKKKQMKRTAPSHYRVEA